MPVEVSEKFTSRLSTTGPNAGGELRFTISGTNDDQEARAALVAAAPATFDVYGDGSAILYRREIIMEPVGDMLWDGVAIYHPFGLEPRFQFDTTGGMRHLTQSRRTVARHAPPDKTAPNHHGAIGVTRNGSEINVEGVDIQVPAYAFEETYFFNPASITPAYKRTLALLSGCVNDFAFKGFARGECKFAGAIGGAVGAQDVEITFKFVCAPNVEDVAVDEIVNIDVEGFQYAWVEYEHDADDDAKATVKKPLAVHVEEVIPYGDFSLLGIGI